MRFTASFDMKVFKTASFLMLCLVLLSACGGPDDTTPLPEGIQTVTGVIVPAEISLVRRGTHLLRIDGEDTYYMESSAVSLRRYEQKEVVLKGVLEQNADPEALPVLVVGQIVEVLEDTMKDWQLRSLGLSLQAPELWEGVVQEGTTEFRTAGIEHPILVITAEETDEEPTGITVVIDDKRAVRQVDEVTGNQTVYVPREEDMLVLTFSPGETEMADSLRTEWLRLLKTIDLDSRSVDTPSTGTGSGAPCGGPAGILCSPGQYCDVTHLEENIGICRPL